MSEERYRLVDHYFQHFLPNVIGKSIFAELDNLDIILGFSITDGVGVWTITLEGGLLIQIGKGASHLQEVSYDMDSQTFLQIVSGVLSPQKAFFLGKTKIRGDKLKGLKLAMIFDRFIKKYPFSKSE